MADEKRVPDGVGLSAHEHNWKPFDALGPWTDLPLFWCVTCKIVMDEGAVREWGRMWQENVALLAALRREQDEHATCEDTNARRFASLQDGITRIAAENAALREIVEAVARCEARESEGWQQVGLFDDTVNVLWIRNKARALLGAADGD